MAFIAATLVHCGPDSASHYGQHSSTLKLVQSGRQAFSLIIPWVPRGRIFRPSMASASSCRAVFLIIHLVPCGQNLRSLWPSSQVYQANGQSCENYSHFTNPSLWADTYKNPPLWADPHILIIIRSIEDWILHCASASSADYVRTVYRINPPIWPDTKHKKHVHHTKINPYETMCWSQGQSRETTASRTNQPLWADTSIHPYPTKLCIRTRFPVTQDETFMHATSTMGWYHNTFVSRPLQGYLTFRGNSLW